MYFFSFLSAESVEAAVVLISGASGVRESGHRKCRIERENALTDNIGGKSSNTDNRVPSTTSPASLSFLLFLKHTSSFFNLNTVLFVLFFLSLPFTMLVIVFTLFHTCPRFLLKFSILSCITTHCSCWKLAYVAACNAMLVL